MVAFRLCEVCKLWVWVWVWVDFKKKIRRAWSGSVETRGARGAEAVGIYADADVC